MLGGVWKKGVDLLSDDWPETERSPGDVTCLTEFQGSHFRKFSGSAQLIEDVVVSLCRSLKQRETDDHQHLTSPTQQRSEGPEFSIVMAEALTWKTTLDFSRRYVLMLAPMMSPFLPKPISIYFPKRLLLSFRVVLAFPIDCRQTRHWHQNRSLSPQG